MSRTRRIRVVAVVAATLVCLGTSQLTASAATTVVINPGTTFQRIDGFGVSEAFGQANAIRNAAGATRQQALNMLFGTADGAGFSILRSLIPSGSDSIEPKSPGSPSAAPTYVWNGNDEATDQGQLWLARQAKGYGVTTFYNDAWSAPGFMKTNGSDSNGGSLCGTSGASCSSGDWRKAYANYLVQHAKYWASAGLTPSALGFVNEPSLKTSYASMLVSASQAASFMPTFSAALKASGLSTKAACCDTLGFDLLPGYISAVGNANAGLWTSHGYSSAPAATVSSGGHSVWESEWGVNGSTWNTSWDDGSTSAGFTWAQRIQTGMTRANLNAFLYWWGISSTGHDSALIGLSGSTLKVSKRYYALSNFSRFIRPGATRIGATSGDGNLTVSAYRNSDGSTVIVVLNTGSSNVSAAYTVSGKSGGAATPFLTNATNSTAAQAAVGLSAGAFTATVPARALVTYLIP